MLGALLPAWLADTLAWPVVNNGETDANIDNDAGRILMLMYNVPMMLAGQGTDAVVYIVNDDARVY